MRIAVTRTGGFAGGRLHAEVDSSQLSDDDASRIRELLSAGGGAAEAAARDSFVYDVALGNARCRITDDALDDETRAVLQRLLER